VKKLNVGVAIGALAAAIASPAATSNTNRELYAVRCTIADPPSRATVEVQMAYASDFCELVSRALAGDVFHAPLLVTPGHARRYTGAAISCRPYYRARRGRITVRNSFDTCDWFNRHAINWIRQPTG